MSVATTATDRDEMIELFQRLPEAQRAAIADFARFLLARHAPEADGDARWEAIIADPRPRPKLDAFLAESAKEEATPIECDLR